MNNLSWEEAFLLAQSYYELNGNLIVNNNYITESGYNLGNWIYNQRRAYKRNELSMGHKPAPLGIANKLSKSICKITYYTTNKINGTGQKTNDEKK